MKQIVILLLLVGMAAYAQFRRVAGGSFIVTNSSATTPVSITTNQAIWVTAITFKGIKAARTDNVGDVWIDFLTANDAQKVKVIAGGEVTYTCAPGTEINLASFYLDVSNAGDGVGVIYQ